MNLFIRRPAVYTALREISPESIMIPATVEARGRRVDLEGLIVRQRVGGSMVARVGVATPASPEVLRVSPEVP